VLNRIFIVVGILAILAIGAAFVVPRFIQWGDYRDRMEVMASEALGTPVKIVGDIHFNLLPAPQLEFADVAIGPQENPVATIGRVKAEFSLMDFLRDHYAVTGLVLDRPTLNLALDSNGIFVSGLNLPERVTTSNISIGNATVVGGALNVSDARTKETFGIAELGGELKLQALRGPFAFQGQGLINSSRYALRLTTSAMDAEGGTRVTAFAQPENKAFSVSTDGLLSTGQAPRFAGDMTVRIAPPPADRADGVRGDLVLAGQVDANTDVMKLGALTLTPDENRAGTRLTGTALVRLGEKPEFDASISGGVVALPPRDATKEEGVQPYELVRLLGELPSPVIPPLPGRLALDLAEFDLRGFSLRDVKVVATSDGESWDVTSFRGRLPGDTQVAISGTLRPVEDRPNFEGKLSVSATRLDALAALWRKPAENNPLFNVPASLAADLVLDGDDLNLRNGVFTLEDEQHGLSGTIGFGPERRLDIAADLGTLNANDTASLLALLPELSGGGAFAVTFPEGHLTLGAANVAGLAGLDGRDVNAEASWGPQGLEVSRLAAADLGGAQLDLRGTLAGTLAEPRVAALGNIAVAKPNAPLLRLALDALGAGQPVRDFLARALPADLKITLEEPGQNGAQVLTATGTLGVAELGLSAQLDGGIAKVLSTPVSITAELGAEDSAGLTAQLGLGDTPLFPQGEPVRLRAVVKGSSADSFETNLTASGGGDSMEFAGTITAPQDGPVTGKGQVKVVLSDASPLAERLGAGGVHVPPIEGTADLAFAGGTNLALNRIEGKSGDAPFGGDLQLTRQGTLGSVTGQLQLASADAASLAGMLAGPAALIAPVQGVWPDGPIAIGEAGRTTRGEIAVSVPNVAVGGKEPIRDARFTVAWDENNVRMRDFSGQLGGGRVGLELGLCCSGAAADKQANGRVTLDNVALDALMPEAVAANLKGTITASAQFSGTGATIAEIFGALNGDGSYKLSGLSIAQLDPQMFRTVAGLSNILDLEPEALSMIVTQALDKGPFTVPELSGAFTIAGGTIRTQNLSAESGGAQLFGGTSLKLADLALDGSFALTPMTTLDEAGLISPTTSQVTAQLSGTLLNPERRVDPGAMVDAIKVRAYELEVDRLEQLRAEDEARQKAAAEERARLIAEQKRLAEEAAAKKAAEDAAKAAAEEAARKAAEDAAPQTQIAPSTDITSDPLPSFMDLNLPQAAPPSPVR